MDDKEWGDLFDDALALAGLDVPVGSGIRLFARLRSQMSESQWRAALSQLQKQDAVVDLVKRGLEESGTQGQLAEAQSQLDQVLEILLRLLRTSRKADALPGEGGSVRAVSGPTGRLIMNAELRGGHGTRKGGDAELAATGADVFFTGSIIGGDAVGAPDED